MDSTMYTFNGHGEYTLLTALDDVFVLQARTAPINGIHEKCLMVLGILPSSSFFFIYLFFFFFFFFFGGGDIARLF